MALFGLNGFDVEHATNLLVYENLFPAIQHINGKGVTDKYTKTDDVRSVTKIDVMRLLPYAPRLRQLGATNNGAYHNANNVGGYRNSPQSEVYTIPVDLVYDEGIAITKNQINATRIEFQNLVQKQLIDTAGMCINIVTYAKQYEAFFRDSFANVATATAAEIAASVFKYDPTLVPIADGSPTDAFVAANSQLHNGIPEIGAFVVPEDERQAFITPQYNRYMKRAYQQNASDSAARINSAGFINPFTNLASTRINEKTGLCGMYDGVDMFLITLTTQRFIEMALSVPTADILAGTNVSGLLRMIGGMIVYANVTVRGIVLPTVEAHVNIYFGGGWLLPYMKMGCEVITNGGLGIKMIVNGGWTATQIASIGAVIAFQPFDGVAIKPETAFASGIFNDGTTN